MGLFDIITTNVNISFETIVLIVVILGCIVFFAGDYKIGLLITWVISGLVTIWFYSQNYNYVPISIIFFIILIILSFSIYFENQKQQTGGLY